MKEEIEFKYHMTFYIHIYAYIEIDKILNPKLNFLHILQENLYNIYGVTNVRSCAFDVQKL